MERYTDLKNGYRFDIGGRKGLRMIAVVVIHADQIEVLYLGDHDGYDKFKP